MARKTRSIQVPVIRVATVVIAATIISAIAGVPVITSAWAAKGESNSDLAHQVREAEMAFAATMADRDHKAFASHVSEEAVFFGGGAVLRGRDAVAAGWAGFYEGPNAPFSWTPDQVEVLESGTLALSSGPVFDPKGNRIGTFNSTWRLEADGVWRVVFDKGCPPCEAPPHP